MSGVLGRLTGSIMDGVTAVRRVIETPHRIEALEARMDEFETQYAEMAKVFVDGMAAVRSIVDAQNAKLNALVQGVDQEVAQRLAADALSDGQQLARFTQRMRESFAEVAESPSVAPTPEVPVAPVPTPNTDEVPVAEDANGDPVAPEQDASAEPVDGGTVAPDGTPVEPEPEQQPAQPVETTEGDGNDTPSA